MSHRPPAFRGLATALLTTVALTALVAFVPTAQARELIFGHGATEDTAYHLSAERFKQLLEEKTGGDLTVSLYSNSVLGHETEMFEQQTAGALDLSIVNPGLISEFSHTASIFSIPFLYRDLDHWRHVLDGEPGQEIARRIEEETGVKVLAYYGGSTRQVVSTRPLESLDDLQGMKLRTNPTRPVITAWAALGTQPTVMAYKEIYTGLQLGAIDGLLNEAEWIYRMRFHEVAPYIGLSEHDITVRLLTISDDTWDSLTPDQRQAVQAAADESEQYARNLQIRLDKESRDKLKAEGATFYPMDRGRMQQIVAEPLGRVIDDLGLRDLYELIINTD
ncbi:TRAP transporter substrate-binding protein [Salinicola acroporae]|uniref:C4-dicarboxylate ABC transporter substrate-binding protein n=1 Tax=Salinicola acroporae TaxID=1541440 RepID=A0ABT6I360_9GAMM|nr:TRAP transporter substrate-binding protein [Salinicola acroporae]MDH4571971.1 C4-dicarboxylate ABC transporter substrate-binding protein [Salinicola acroporae]